MGGGDVLGQTFFFPVVWVDLLTYGVTNLTITDDWAGSDKGRGENQEICDDALPLRPLKNKLGRAV